MQVTVLKQWTNVCSKCQMEAGRVLGCRNQKKNFSVHTDKSAVAGEKEIFMQLDNNKKCSAGPAQALYAAAQYSSHIDFCVAWSEKPQTSLL